MVIDQYQKQGGCVNADNSNFWQLLWHRLFEIQVTGFHNSQMFFSPLISAGNHITALHSDIFQV